MSATASDPAVSLVVSQPTSATHRPYRTAMTPEAAQELRRWRNTRFDPRVVEAIERVLHADGAALAVVS
jgi:HD-GYP domain-containing protein (c-di-GMP phosphodiesterase class II)